MSLKRLAFAKVEVSRSTAIGRQDGPPFYMIAIIFVAAFGTLAISFWRYMIPSSITIAEAASTTPASSSYSGGRGSSYSGSCLPTPR
jgi:cytochrome bd-type quinol oxidase subunit 2